MGKLKKILLIIFAAAVVGLLVYVVPYEKKVDVEISGVMYRLGTGDEAETASVTVQGIHYKRLFQSNYTVFNVTISGEENVMRTTGNYEKNGKSMGSRLYYWSTGESGSGVVTVGNMYFTDDAKKVIILLYEQKENGRATWTSDGGRVIVAPAKDRDEAARLAKSVAANTDMAPLESWE